MSLINMVALAVLCAVAWMDGRHRSIPDVLVLCLCVCAVSKGIVLDTVLRTVISGTVLLAAALLVALVFGGMGGGDIKLIGALGAFLGLEQALVCIILSLLLLGIYGLIRRKAALPYAPFLVIAYGLTIIW